MKFIGVRTDTPGLVLVREADIEGVNAIIESADALADAVEALNLETDDGRAFGDPPRVEMTPHVSTLDAIAAALKAYRDLTGSP